MVDPGVDGVSDEEIMKMALAKAVEPSSVEEIQPSHHVEAFRSHETEYPKKVDAISIRILPGEAQD